MCSLSREAFELNNLSFEHHIYHEHNMWQYLYYVIYLKQRPKLLLTGTERYIQRMVNRKKIDWLPMARSLSLGEKSVAPAPDRGSQRGRGAGDSNSSEQQSNAGATTGTIVTGQELASFQEQMLGKYDGISNDVELLKKDVAKILALLSPPTRNAIGEEKNANIII
mmetsp:Transcript_9735/g.16808  ORF Transcript_9735/g.16808 Transcript_9735/m.16808 type:complete len:166 (+) Transcript_9735:1-498(+)